MAKMYSVGGDGLTLANQAVTLVGILPAAAVSPMLNITRMWASQQTSAVSAQQRIQAVTQASVYPTVVTATPRHLKRSDTVASLIVGVGGVLTAGTCGINASAEGAGTKTVMFGDNFNVLNGYLWVATPPEVIELTASDASSFGLFLPAAAASLTNWGFGINYGEGALS
jgi:hypothetical protein